MNIKKVALPDDSMLSEFRYDYADSYQGTISTPTNIEQEQLGKVFFLSAPQWVHHLMGIRNRIVSIFGLKTGNTPDKKDLLKNLNLTIGKSIGIFKIFDKNDTEIILGEDDSHLNFRVSLLLGSYQKEKTITISTIVIFNNWFGKLYFLPVQPFHKYIVRHMLQRTLQELNQ